MISIRFRYKIFLPALVVSAILLFAGHADAIWIVTPTGDKIEAGKPQKVVVTLQTNLIIKSNTIQTNQLFPKSHGELSLVADQSFHVSGLRLEMISSSNRLSWANPTGQAGFKLRVYRAGMTLRDTEALGSAVLLAEFSNTVASTQNFTDTSPNSEGDSFYAVMLVGTNRNENRIFLPSETYTTNKTSRFKEGTPVYDLSIALTPDKKQLLLEWKCATDGIGVFHVYRSSAPIRNVHDLPFIKTDVDKMSYGEPVPSPGNYYYAVTPEISGLEVREVVSNRNMIPEPVRVEIVSIQTQGISFASTKTRVQVKQSKGRTLRSFKECNDRLNASLKRYYSNHRYKESINDLSSILHADNCPVEVLNRTKLYLGKSYYYDKQYRPAFKCFFDLLKTFPVEADFWMKLTMGKLKQL